METPTLLGFQALITSFTQNPKQWSIYSKTIKNKELNLIVWMTPTLNCVAYKVDGKLYFPFSEKQSIQVGLAFKKAFPGAVPHTFVLNTIDEPITRTKIAQIQTSSTNGVTPKTIAEAKPINQKHFDRITAVPSGLTTNGFRIVKKANGKTPLDNVNVYGYIPFNYQPNFSIPLLNSVALKVYNLFQFGSFIRPSFLPALAR